jgi:hypothetical protein
VTIGGNAEGFLVIGAALKFQVSIDLENGAISASGSVALGAGFGGGIGGEASVSTESINPVSGLNAKTDIKATGNLLGFEAETTLVTIDEGQKTKPFNTEFSAPIGVGENGVTLKPELKASANVRVEGTIEGTTTIIPDTVNALKDAAQNFLEGAEKASNCLVGAGGC